MIFITEEDNKTRYVFKICLIGSGGVGKTCIARRLCFNTFDLNTKLTVGIDFFTYSIPITIKGEEASIKLSIWDFGGQEQFKTLFKYYISGAHGIFLVFDLLSMESLIKLNWWYDKLVDFGVQDRPKILVGTKLDLAKLEDKQFRVDKLIIQQFLQKHDENDYVKTSSKDNTNILHSFKEMVKKIMVYNELEFDEIL
ncbi:MAG: GTP-binding protein [Promethearchaeota archaeon]|nr:MAG: GTP-binding protein [Candidatus Lokiarchaeota archaeon]